MKILIDECLPVGLKDPLVALGFECDTARDAGLTGKKNGELLALAEGRWDVLLTGDGNVKSQQNIKRRKIAIVVIRAKSNRMVDLLPSVPLYAPALQSIEPVQVTEVWCSPTGSIIRES